MALDLDWLSLILRFDWTLLQWKWLKVTRWMNATTYLQNTDFAKLDPLLMPWDPVCEYHKQGQSLKTTGKCVTLSQKCKEELFGHIGNRWLITPPSTCSLRGHGCQVSSNPQNTWFDCQALMTPPSKPAGVKTWFTVSGLLLRFNDWAENPFQDPGINFPRNPIWFPSMKQTLWYPFFETG